MDRTLESGASNPATIAAQCIGVEKSFGGGATRLTVLHSVNFEAHFGEMTYLVGPSGCGKTTLISILGGLLTPDKGEVSMLNQRIDRMWSGALADFRLKNIGFIFQQFNLLPTLTAVENAATPLTAAGVSSRLAGKRATELLSGLGLEKHLFKYPRQLSGGQQQRVAIARALVHEPKVIICDEPTASLDGETGHTVMCMLRDQAVRPDRAVIVVTHDQRIFEFADRIATMSDGKIL